MKRIWKIRIILAVIFILVCFWQALEHKRAVQRGRASVLDRATDISNTIGVVIRSESHFVFVSQNKLERALSELVESKELQSVALLNTSEKIVASAGDAVDVVSDGFPGKKAVWKEDSVIVTNIVDLGINVKDEISSSTSPILVKPSQRPSPRDRDRFTSIAISMIKKFGRSERRPKPPPHFRRPPWISREKFDELREKQGLHGFILKISTRTLNAEISRDLWIRIVIVGITLIALIGVAAALRSFEKSEQLRINLVKMRELNRHLKELNIAAAGLAHETRNPLNLVRGQAQILSREKDVPPQMRKQAQSIVEEVDRVTSRLSEFINYSRPAVPKPAPVNLPDVINDVARTLSVDMEEKSVDFRTSLPDLTIDADEGMLRQALFNLLMNAVQSVKHDGRISVNVEVSDDGKAQITIEDNGCGIPEENREEVFRPYFTTGKEGAGLGLSVVQRFVQAHGWSIKNIPADGRGTKFIINGIKILRTSK